MKHYDVIVVGGGILGCFAARELSRYHLRVLVLERGYDLGEGASKANSGILYPGYHPRGGSLKGISCVQGNAMYDALCPELDIPMQKIGSLFVAFHPDGEAAMLEKYQKGLENGAQGLEIISGAEARHMEPLLTPQVTRAMYAPNTGIISPFQLILAVAESAHRNGVEFRFEAEVTGMSLHPDGIELCVGSETLTTRYAVNTAGENAALVEHWVRKQDLKITPRRGQYYIFDKHNVPILNHVIYQAQEIDEGGTLITPTVEGNLLAGPTSENVRDYCRTETTAEGLAHVERVAKKLLPDLDIGRVIASFAGVRANITNVEKERKDFVVRVSDGRLVSALGIKNPGMTAAPYLAQKLVQQLAEQGLLLVKKEGGLIPVYRQKPFLQESLEKQAELFVQDARYARVICRCEGITEGDIIYALHAPLPPHSLNGLKTRLRVGMGRCQGGFCTSRILEVISRETGCRPQDFVKGQAGSSLVKGWVK